MIMYPMHIGPVRALHATSALNDSANKDVCQVPKGSLPDENPEASSSGILDKSSDG